MRSSYDKAAEAIGSSVGGLSTKIHAKVDSFGQLVNILIALDRYMRVKSLMMFGLMSIVNFFWRIRLTILIVFGRL
jgi:hypothetical protein